MPLTCSSLCDFCAEPSDCAGNYQSVKETPVPLTNPKELAAAADGKAPLEYLEAACNPGEARVLKGGAERHGRRNFTLSPIRAQVYVGALRRHIDAWAGGEDTDPDSGESHLSHIRANVAVLQSAMAAGTFVDDRGEAAVRTPEPATLSEQCCNCYEDAGTTVCGRTRYKHRPAAGSFAMVCPLTGSAEWVGD